MSLTRAPERYDQRDQDRLRAEIERLDAQNRKREQDVEIVGAERLILYSPDGSPFYLAVADDGTLTAEAVS